MVTFAVDEPLEPAAAAVLWPDDDPELLVDDLLLEHPERPTTTIAVAAAATVIERFTRAPLPLWGSTGTSQTVSAVCGVTEQSVSDSPKISLPVSAAHPNTKKILLLDRMILRWTHRILLTLTEDSLLR
jgi:hypothetical protein